jgi:hypothetical protein
VTRIEGPAIFVGVRIARSPAASRSAAPAEVQPVSTPTLRFATLPTERPRCDFDTGRQAGACDF